MRLRLRKSFLRLLKEDLGLKDALVWANEENTASLDILLLTFSRRDNSVLLSKPDPSLTGVSLLNPMRPLKWKIIVCETFVEGKPSPPRIETDSALSRLPSSHPGSIDFKIHHASSSSALPGRSLHTSSFHTKNVASSLCVRCMFLNNIISDFM